VGDGVTDDTTAINSAMTACYNAGGGYVYFPASTYIITSQLVVKNKVKLRGDGERTSTIKLGGSFPSSTYGIKISDTVNTIAYDARVEILNIECNSITGSGGVQLDNTAQERSGVFGCIVTNFKDYGIKAVSSQNCGVEDLELNQATGATGGISWSGVSGRSYIRNVSIVPNAGTGTYGINANNCNNVVISDIQPGSHTYGVYFAGSGAGIISHIYAGGNSLGPTTYLVYLTGGSADVVLMSIGNNGYTNTVYEGVSGTTYADSNIDFLVPRQIQMGQCRVYTGVGSPAGSITANVGSLYLRADGGTSTTLYVKESGSGTSGWVAK
jgi:hypothetical protein